MQEVTAHQRASLTEEGNVCTKHSQCYYFNPYPASGYADHPGEIKENNNNTKQDTNTKCNYLNVFQFVLLD